MTPREWQDEDYWYLRLFGLGARYDAWKATDPDQGTRDPEPHGCLGCGELIDPGMDYCSDACQRANEGPDPDLREEDTH